MEVPTAEGLRATHLFTQTPGAPVVVDRIERHDVLNAVMLAAVLLLLGFGILSAVDRLAATVDEGLVESTKEPEPETTDDDSALAATTTTDPDDAEETTSLPDARPPGQVTVRVGNGARRAGVAGAGTEVLEAAGYPTLAPKNGPTMDDSIVYYVAGYVADAAKVAELLGLEATRTEPMPSDPGIPIEGAQVIAILGVNSEF